MGEILPTSLVTSQHIVAFDRMVEERFAEIDVQAVLIYLIDTVKSSALSTLANQFDVEGYKGFSFATTDQERRSVLQRAIELHRFKGTPWSIKEALKSIGYYDVTIQERLTNEGIIYDGTHYHNGTSTYNAGHWADFKVTLDIGSSMGITALSAQQAVILINEYKNVRSRLVAMNYGATLVEYMGMSDELEITINILPIYDGTHLHDGTINY